MKRSKRRYLCNNEPPALEIAFSAIARLDAWLVLLWGKVLILSERFVEKGLIIEGFFTLGLISGLIFVLKTVSQRPEFNYTPADTFKTCIVMSLGIFILRYLCARSAREVKKLSIKASEKAIRMLQPFRSTTVFFLFAIGIFSSFSIGKYASNSSWYADGYSYITICSFCLIMGIYAHSASIYLDVKNKIIYEDKELKTELLGTSDE